MKKLNNNGQTLVLFVLLLPIMLCIIVLVFDIGKFICIKQELNNINSLAISYGIEHYNEDDIENKIIKLILLNNSNLDNIKVSTENNKVSIQLLYSDSSILGNIFNINIFKVESSYIADIENKKIERIK